MCNRYQWVVDELCLHDHEVPSSFELIFLLIIDIVRGLLNCLDDTLTRH